MKIEFEIDKPTYGKVTETLLRYIIKKYKEMDCSNEAISLTVTGILEGLLESEG